MVTKLMDLLALAARVRAMEAHLNTFQAQLANFERARNRNRLDAYVIAAMGYTSYDHGLKQGITDPTHHGRKALEYAKVLMAEVDR